MSIMIYDVKHNLKRSVQQNQHYRMSNNTVLYWIRYDAVSVYAVYMSQSCIGNWCKYLFIVYQHNIFQMKDFFEIGNMANSQDKELTKEGEFEEISIVVATKLSPHSWVLYYMKYNARLQTKAQRIFNFTARNSWLVCVWWCISLLVTQVDQVGHICYTRVYIFSIIYLLGTIYFEFIHNWGDVINRNTCYFVYFHQNRSQHSFCRILREKKFKHQHI